MIGRDKRARVVKERTQRTGTKGNRFAGAEILDIGGGFEIEVTGIGDDVAIGDFNADHSQEIGIVIGECMTG